MAEQNQGARLQDKVVIVTGGAQGIGKGIADVFEEQGATVVILDIQDEVGAAIKGTGVGEILYMHCDMRKEDEIKSSIQEIVNRLGRIDCLINNVGWFPGPYKIDELTVEDFAKLLELDLLSTFMASKYSLPYLRKTKGSIVNISSQSKNSGMKNSCTYAAAKGGVSGFTKALSMDEAEHGVRVNSVAPGSIDTPLLQSSFDAESMKILNSCHALGRIGTPREVGLTCVFLGFDATFTTGHELSCTGGCDLGFGIKDPKLPF